MGISNIYSPKVKREYIVIVSGDKSPQSSGGAFHLSSGKTHYRTYDIREAKHIRNTKNKTGAFAMIHSRLKRVSEY